MNSDLQHLIHLQDLELIAERVRQRVTDLPLAQAAPDARVAARTVAVEAVKGRIGANLAARRDIEKDLAAVQARLSKYRDQLMEVKTNKEYQAMQKEMAVAETEIRGHEDRLLDQMEEAETLAAELKAAETALRNEQAEVAREQQALSAERAAMDTQVERTSAARREVLARLSAQTVALFERIAHGRRGLAVAEAKDGLCTACHVRLRPQVFNEVRRNDGLHQCDSCTRILYFVPAATQTAS